TNSSVRTTALGCIGAGAGRQVAAGVLGQGGEQLLGGAEVLADRGVVLAALAGGGVVEHGLVLGLGGPGALVVHGPTVPRGCGAAPGAAGGRPVGHRLLLLHRVVRTASVMVPVASAIVTCTRSSISRGEYHRAPRVSIGSGARSPVTPISSSRHQWPGSGIAGGEAHSPGSHRRSASGRRQVTVSPVSSATSAARESPSWSSWPAGGATPSGYQARVSRRMSSPRRGIAPTEAPQQGVREGMGDLLFGVRAGGPRDAPQDGRGVTGAGRTSERRRVGDVPPALRR